MNTNGDCPINEKSLPNTLKKTVKWDLSNGKKEPPSSESMVWDVNLDKYGVIVNKIPGLSKESPYYYIGALKWKYSQKDKGSRWITNAVYTGDTETLGNYRLNIDLPMKSYDVSSFKNDDAMDYEVWHFMNKQNVISICKYPKYDINLSDWNKSKLRNLDAYLNSNKQRESLLYFEEDYIITVTGNSTKAELEKLVLSLPSIRSGFLPHKKENPNVIRKNIS